MAGSEALGVTSTPDQTRSDGTPGLVQGSGNRAEGLGKKG